MIGAVDELSFHLDASRFQESAGSENLRNHVLVPLSAAQLDLDSGVNLYRDDGAITLT